MKKREYNKSNKQYKKEYLKKIEKMLDMYIADKGNNITNNKIKILESTLGLWGKSLLLSMERKPTIQEILRVGMQNRRSDEEIAKDKYYNKESIQKNKMPSKAVTLVWILRNKSLKWSVNEIAKIGKKIDSVIKVKALSKESKMYDDVALINALRSKHFKYDAWDKTISLDGKKDNKGGDEKNDEEFDKFNFIADKVTYKNWSRNHQAKRV